MIYPYTIYISWTKFLTENSKEFDDREVLYMYYTDYKSVYIGKAHRQTVWERFKGHERDGVNEWIRKHIKEPCKIKVGYLVYDSKEMRYSEELLHDIESLFIFKERNNRGFCEANNMDTITRNFYRSGMKIINSHHYKPLLKYYYDE